LINNTVDTLTKEECQALIDRDHVWEDVEKTKIDGSIIKFKTADVVVWGDHYPNILKECVMKYEVGDFCTEHKDSTWSRINPNYQAYAVWVTPLNDGYEGGELYFNSELVEQVIGVQNKYLRTIPHEITEITKGTRYSLVSWVFKQKC